MRHVHLGVLILFTMLVVGLVLAFIAPNLIATGP
jgi:hypothetical protein